MKILLLGGTGVMGVPLSQILAEQNNIVFVTSRKQHSSQNKNIRYVIGNAKNDVFLHGLLSTGKYDAIIDFMSYKTDEFRKRVDLLLDATRHYVFINSARVFAQCQEPITETSPRVLDICKDKKYLETDDYALAKARQEDILKKSGKLNYTIIRPSVIYGRSRLQLGAFDKEHWLYRALKGRSIVFSHDMENILTAMTNCIDAAGAIASVVAKETAFGKAFNIADNKSYTWGEILEIYLDTLEGLTKKRPNVVMTEKTIRLCDKAARTQILNARGIDRRFDDRAIKAFYREDFTPPSEGLPEALKQFLKAPTFLNIDFRLEALSDKASGETTPLSEIPTFRNKVTYLCYKHGLGWFYQFLVRLKSLAK